MYPFRRGRVSSLPLCWVAAAFLGVGSRTLIAQDASTAPASVPAGVLPATPADSAAPPAKPVPEKQAREADDAYLAGAKAMQRGDLDAAEREFGRATKLNPSRPEYAQSLAIAREHRVQALITQAATARHAGNTTLAETLLAQARELAPDSRSVTEHFETSSPSYAVVPGPAIVEADDPLGTGKVPQFGAGIELKPHDQPHSFHQTGSMEDILRAVYGAYGIKVQFPNVIGAGRTLRFDLDDADYATASRVINKIANAFVVPVQADQALIVANNPDGREQYQPLLEETFYMPGLSTDAMAEMANLARQMFDLNKITASQSQSRMIVRGDAKTLQLLNATYADMLSGNSDVQVDIAIYEVDKSFTRNFGVTTPASVGAFSVYGEVQSLLTQNASIIQTAISSGALTLTGNPSVDIPKEIAILYAAGDLSGVSQLTNLLGTLGTFGGIPLAGVYLSGGAALNATLNNTDVRSLDFAQLRAGDHQSVDFRAGTRYPVITGVYSSGISSSTISGLSSAQQQLVNQYLGASTAVSIPQFQYEDLGLTLKAKPTVLGDKNVRLELDMKIEALGGTSINNVPVLNNRALASTITVPTGETVLLASEVTKSEMRSISGVPGLNDLPGFQGTDRDTEKDTSELLITLTPHIVREAHHETASKRLAWGTLGDSSQ